MLGLEAHRDMFGAPETGVHALRVGGFAAVDVLATAAAAVLLWLLVARRTGRLDLRVLLAALFALFALGVAAHRLFGVRTTADRLLFGRL